MLLSFIIPLYNCEKYIDTCLSSIFLSNLHEKCFEVIIVDDGSKDNGANIVERWKNKHDNINLLRQQNKGASSARNIGIEASNGEYIWFVDADDKIESSFLEYIYGLINSKPEIDLFCFNYKKEYTEKNVPLVLYDEIKTISGVDYLNKHEALYIWNKIFKRKSIGDIRFLEGTKNIEDMLFDVQTIINMNKVCCINKFGYIYNNTNISSTSRSLNNRNLIKLSQDTKAVHKELLKLLHSASTTNKQKKVIASILNFSIAGHLYSLLRFYSPKYLKKNILFYRSNGLYPVRRTYSFKANFFLYFANNEKLLLLIYKIYSKLKNT